MIVDKRHHVTDEPRTHKAYYHHYEDATNSCIGLFHNGASAEIQEMNSILRFTINSKNNFRYNDWRVYNKVIDKNRIIIID